MSSMTQRTRRVLVEALEHAHHRRLAHVGVGIPQAGIHRLELRGTGGNTAQKEAERPSGLHPGSTNRLSAAQASTPHGAAASTSGSSCRSVRAPKTVPRHAHGLKVGRPGLSPHSP